MIFIWFGLVEGVRDYLKGFAKRVIICSLLGTENNSIKTIKGAVSVISIKPKCIDIHARFTTVR